MESDDVIYLVLLFFSIAFGKVIRSFEDGKMRRNVATVVGFLTVLLVSGRDIWHPLVLILVNALVITTLQKSIIHIVSFTFSFGYLVFFRTTEYFGIPYPSGHTNLIQMILTLKLVGLAFEVKDTFEGIAKGRKDPEFELIKVPNPTISTIVHYSFCYIGLLTGPYYSYKTYLDMLNMPFFKYANCSRYAIDRLKFVPMYAVIFVISTYYFPFDYALSDDFYENKSVLYRLWYSIPLFTQFRMRMYIGMKLSEGVCIMGGAGCYPVETEPQPGRGPTKNFAQLSALCNDPKKAQALEYNFTTVHNIEPSGAEWDITVRSAMRSWNMSIQYWLANFVFRRIPVKSLRLFATFVVSAFWHGIYAGYYCTICSVPLYLPVEDVYYRNLKDVKLPFIVKEIWRVVGFSWRLFLKGYWAITFRLLTFEASFRYWRSVYFIPTFVTIAMYALSFLIFKKKSKDSRSPNSEKRE